MNSSNDPENKKLTLWQIISSVLAAAIGVQSNKNRQRDFTKAKPSTYIIAGVLFTLFFIITLVTIVRLVLNTAGG
ncbi:MAG: DUF2970 domain-containing protein [Pseudomonadales bacterium]|nr:DUF2970 domain-containing protein [Pseudomonadales bacterium]